MPSIILSFTYVNYMGETSQRKVQPIYTRFGSTEFHPERQHLLFAFDLDRQENREFAIADISNISFFLSEGE